jgi:glycosyltransferase involved in cell wall biosynthesis
MMRGRDWQAGGTGVEAARLSLILPCFNEAANIRPLYASIRGACEGIPLELIFVDDASTDGTCAEVDLLAALDPRVRLIRFVRNAGHQNALRAGYRAARGQYVATLDADLQHPPALLPAMLAKAQEGYDVVQMVREGAQTGFVKEICSRAFYRIYNWLSEVPIQPQASDFRLVSRAVCDALNTLPERQLIVRAILPYLGFRTASLPYRLGERLHGQASFSFSKSLHLGSEALFGFSVVPLKLAMRLGLLISVLAFIYGIYNVGAKFFTDRNVPGYTDLIASVLFLGGVILLYLGIIGRYILVILDHLKRRPEYVIAAGPEGMSRDPRKENQHAVPVPSERAGSDSPSPARPEGRRAGA